MAEENRNRRAAPPLPRIVKIAICLLTGHTLLLFLFGGIWSLGFFGVPFPLLLTSLLIIIAVPWAIVCLLNILIGDKQRLTSRQQKRHWLLVIALMTVFLLYLCSPGALLCYPISDTGFRLLVGNRLQACAVALLQKPDSAIRTKPGIFTTFVDRTAVPPCLRHSGINYEYITIGGEKPEERHIGIVCGGGFGHWGLYVGAPNFRVPDDTQGVRRMWDGVYLFAGE